MVLLGRFRIVCFLDCVLGGFAVVLMLLVLGGLGGWLVTGLPVTVVCMLLWICGWFVFLLECVSFVLLYDFCNGDCFGLFDLLVSLLVGSGGCLY